jgi:type II secretory pathway pseudopilin PulG
MEHKRTIKSRKAFTLVEVMVYSVLIGVVLAGVYGTLIFSMRYFNAINKISELQDQVLIALSRLEMDISETSVLTSNTTTSDEKSKANDSIIFAAYKDSSGQYMFNADTGKPKLQSWICYYLESDGQGTHNLVIKRKKIDPPSDTIPATPPDITNDTSIPRQVIARKISRLTITSGSNIGIIITADGTENANKPYRITAQTEINLRNN